MPDALKLEAVLPPEVLEAIAQRAAALVLAEQGALEQDRWLDAKQAARHLGLSVNALHRLTAARTIPFSQDAPNARCWFKRSELDAWRRGEQPRRRSALPSRSHTAPNGRQARST